MLENRRKTLRINGESQNSESKLMSIMYVTDEFRLFGDHKIEWNIGRISIIRKQKQKVVKLFDQRVVGSLGLLSIFLNWDASFSWLVEVQKSMTIETVVEWVKIKFTLKLIPHLKQAVILSSTVLHLDSDKERCDSHRHLLFSPRSGCCEIRQRSWVHRYELKRLLKNNLMFFSFHNFVNITSFSRPI
jgi:hypothetical protein